MSERPVRRNETLRETWFDAASEVLASQGYGALKLAVLCKRLGVTTGSFYHSFDNWQDFTDSLLANWLAERTDQIIEIAKVTDDPVTQLKTLAQAAFEFQHRTEAAIRVWAGVDDHVASVQRKVDEARHRTVAEAMTSLVGADRAPAYATWALSTLIGFEMLADRSRREDLLWALESILADAERVTRTDR